MEWMPKGVTTDALAGPQAYSASHTDSTQQATQPYQPKLDTGKAPVFGR